MTDFLWISFGRVISALIALYSLRLSTSLLPPQEYGLLSILVTFQVFCGLFLINPVGQYINRHTHSWTEDGTLGFRLKKFGVWILIAASLGAITSGLWGMTQDLNWQKRVMVIIATSTMVIASTWNATFISTLNMLGYRAISVIWGTCSMFFCLLFSYFFVKIAGGGIAWFFGQALGMTIGALGARKYLNQFIIKPNEEKPNFIEKNTLRNYIVPLAISTGLMWWTLSGYRLIIEYHWGLLELGTITVGLLLASQIWGLIETLIIQFFFPMFYQKISSNNPSYAAVAYSDLINITGPVYLILTSAMLIAAPSLLILLIDNSYQNALPFFMLGIGIECCRVLVNIIAKAAQIGQLMKKLITPYFIGAIFMTICILILILLDSESLNAIIVLVVSGLITFFSMTMNMKKITTIKIDYYRWAISFTILIISIITSWIFPTTQDSILSSIITLTYISFATLLLIILFQWKNPHLIRLLKTQLNGK